RRHTRSDRDWSSDVCSSDLVSFEYEPSESVLRDVDLEVKRGQVVAIVGPSGAGKTTLVDLLPRFYEPTRGEILMDGVPLTNYTRSEERRVGKEGRARRWVGQ